MRPIVTLLVGLVLLTPLATADDCEREAVAGTEATGYFSVDHDLCQPGCLFSLWVYHDDDADPCAPDEASSTIIL